MWYKIIWSVQSTQKKKKKNLAWVGMYVLAWNIQNFFFYIGWIYFRYDYFLPGFSYCNFSHDRLMRYCNYIHEYRWYMYVHQIQPLFVVIINGQYRTRFICTLLTSVVFSLVIDIFSEELLNSIYSYVICCMLKSSVFLLSHHCVDIFFTALINCIFYIHIVFFIMIPINYI